jgi:cytoskeletal protein CcmA (bactofilin family)
MSQFLRDMFSGRRASISDAQRLSRIRSGTEVQGAVTADSASAVLVEGVLVGDILGDSTVYIAAGGAVRGAIEAREVIVAGEVLGNITAKERCEVHATGQVLGDVRTSACLIVEGARVAGRVQIGDIDARTLRALEVRDAGVREVAPRDGNLRSFDADGQTARSYRMVLGS